MNNTADTKSRYGIVTKETQNPGMEYTLNNKGDTNSRHRVATKEKPNQAGRII